MEQRKTTVWLDADVDDALNHYKVQNRVSRKAFINQALRAALEVHPDLKDAEESALVREALELHRALAARGKESALADMLEYLRDNL